MLSKTMLDAINEQINAELYSAYLYLSMSAHCTATNLPGSAAWMRVQAQEERSHAMKFFDSVHDRGGRVTLRAVAGPPTEFTSLLDIFQQTLEHEQEVTRKIHRLYENATKENDYATQVELQWFIKEQVEEEKSAGEIVQQLKMIGDQPAVLIMLDRHLGMRAASK